MAQNPARTTSGLVEGNIKGDVLSFLGVPYALPPCREGRWKPAQEMYNWGGVRLTKKFGSRCEQIPNQSIHDPREPHQSEDCLYANVWTLENSKKNPVMVFIHSGGFAGGSGCEDAYDGANLAKKGATVVTFNYRLGPFGFAAHPQMEDNLGLDDQVFLLRWVRKNIEAFGGNQRNVTIFGHGSGAACVRYLLSVPAKPKIFHRAIMQSGGFARIVNESPRTKAQAMQATAHLLQHIGPTSNTANLQSFRNVCVMAAEESAARDPQPGMSDFHVPHDRLWAPIPRSNRTVKHVVPVMIGCTSHEAEFFLPHGSTFPSLQVMAAYLCGVEAADEVVRIVTASGEKDERKQLERLMTAAIFVEPFLASLRGDAVQFKTYAYYFTRRCPGLGDPSLQNNNSGPRHGDEVPYVFGNLGIYDENLHDDMDFQLSEQMQNAWLTFAKTGKPNIKKGVPWPQCEPESLRMVWFGDGAQKGSFPMCELVSVLQQTRSAKMEEMEEMEEMEVDEGEVGNVGERSGGAAEQVTGTQDSDHEKEKEEARRLRLNRICEQLRSGGFIR